MDGEPVNNFGGRERCALFLIKLKRLVDVDCEAIAGKNQIYRFVCEKDNDVDVSGQKSRLFSIIIKLLKNTRIYKNLDFYTPILIFRISSNFQDDTENHPFWKLLVEAARRIGLMKNVKPVDDSYLKERVSNYEKLQKQEINEAVISTNGSAFYFSKSVLDPGELQGLELTLFQESKLRENSNITFIDPIPMFVSLSSHKNAFSSNSKRVVIFLS